MVAVEMAADQHAQPRAGAPPGLFGELERHALGGDDIVASHHPLGLDAEDLVEIDASEGDEGRGGIGGQPAELRVEGREEVLAQVAIGGGAVDRR